MALPPQQQSEQHPSFAPNTENTQHSPGSVRPTLQIPRQQHSLHSHRLSWTVYREISSRLGLTPKLQKLKTPTWETSTSLLVGLMLWQAVLCCISICLYFFFVQISATWTNTGSTDPPPPPAFQNHLLSTGHRLARGNRYLRNSCSAGGNGNMRKIQKYPN